MKPILAVLVILLLVLACRKATPDELRALDGVTPTPTPPPSPTATPTEAKPMATNTRTPVLPKFGEVVVPMLERRAGPGEGYASLPVPLKAGDVVTVYDCVHDGGDVWVRIGEGVWAAARFGGRELIHGGCR